jgi:muramoyltetrapeptide carboxypeptidase
MDRCHSLGLEPIVFPSAGARHGFLAGTDAQRLADLQAAFDDPAVDAVWSLRGGYGTLRIFHRLDLSRQRRATIPFIGFSDNTALHMRHIALGVISFHAPHPAGDFPPETEAWFRRVLYFAEPPGALPARAIDPTPRTLVGGNVEGPLVGGNLALLAAMCGMPEALKARGHIVFFEDVGEPAYRVDRMLLQLERSGALDRILGIAFGRFSDVPDGDELPVLDVLAEFAQRLGVPTVVDLPFGHVEHNCALPVGGRARLDADGATLEITEPAVR